jgi:hypothetical protein
MADSASKVLEEATDIANEMLKGEETNAENSVRGGGYRERGGVKEIFSVGDLSTEMSPCMR